MDRIEKIDSLRKTYNFPSKSYRRVLKKMPKCLETVLEINTSKYYEKENLNFLKKNLRLLKRKNSFVEYQKYIEALLSNSCDALVEVRNSLINFPTFIDKIDLQLNSLDFDLSQFKHKCYWHDIEILFNSEKKANEFESRTLVVEDSKYNSMLVKHVLKVEKRKLQLENLIQKDNSRIRCILGKVKVYLKALSAFEVFLKENFVESKALKTLKNEATALQDFYENLLEGHKSEYNAHESFKGLADKIKESSNHVKTDKKKVRKEILNDLEKFFSCSPQMNIPLLPEFYDIAYDYIQYPPVDQKTMEVLSSLFE